MEISNLRVTLLPHTPFLKENGKFDLQKAMTYQGQIGGICYNEDGLMASFDESLDKTEKRVNQTTSGEHQSVFEHVNVGLYLQDTPKFLNMILNNEHQYSTSERSLRYTIIKDDGNIPSEMVELYNKWNNIFFDKIKDKYGQCKNDRQIMKLAQENSRYLMPVTMSTEMVHTIPLAQLNRIVKYLMDYRDNGIKDNLHEQMVPHINRFIEQLYEVNVIDDRLLSNRKHRSLSIFGDNLCDTIKEFGEVYSTVYKGSFASLAQAQRHRTIYYQMERDPNKDYFIPPIIEDDTILTYEWLTDMRKVVDKYDYIPQGEKVFISEKGTFDNFILKMKERLCSAAQLEVAMQTKDTLEDYYTGLSLKNSSILQHDLIIIDKREELLTKLETYRNGARCTFPDYDCPRDCQFKEGKTLVRKI